MFIISLFVAQFLFQFTQDAEAAFTNHHSSTSDFAHDVILLGRRHLGFFPDEASFLLLMDILRRGTTPINEVCVCVVLFVVFDP